jgi:hypothetical protein
MNTMRINLLHPKAAKLLKDLEELNLISIEDKSDIGFADVLKKLRAKSKSAPHLKR